MKKIVTLILCIILIGAFRSPTRAYVLPGPFILEMMAKKTIGKADRILVKQTLNVFPSDPAGEPVKVDETLRYIFSVAFRSDMISKYAHRVHVATTTESVTVLDQTILSDSETRFDQYKDVFLYNTRQLLEKKLTSFGIDFSISSLGRFENRIAFILGSEYSDKSKSQIWIEKETFRPVRLLLADSENSEQQSYFEIRYLDWIDTEDIRYPRRIEFYRSNRLIRTIDVKKIQTDPYFPAHLFDISALKAAFTASRPPLSESGEADEVNEVKKTIEEFKKIYD